LNASINFVMIQIEVKQILKLESLRNSYTIVRISFKLSNTSSYY